MKYLEKLWLDIEAKTHIAGAPCLLYSDVSISRRVLRDIVTEQTGKIIVDNPEVFEELQRFGKNSYLKPLNCLSYITASVRFLINTISKKKSKLRSAAVSI